MIPLPASPPARRRPAASALAALCLAAACAPASERARPAPPVPRVVFETAAGARHEVAVELARTPAEQARGLMGRTSLAEEAGMLFLFDASAPHPFWMKDTLIPLDMIFVDDGGRIVGVAARAEPLTLSPRGPAAPSRYVVEVNGGWAERHGVAPGDRVRFEDVPRY